MANDFLRQSNWRAEMVGKRTGKSYGLWNHGELAFGSEAGEVVDPEDGNVPIGGRKTAENVEINRPWKRTRDRAVYQELKPLRGGIEMILIIHELDDFGQPVSSTPLDTLDAVLLEVKASEADKGGGDPSTIMCTLQVRA